MIEINEPSIKWYQHRLKTCEDMNYQPGIKYYKRILAIAERQKKKKQEGSN